MTVTHKHFKILSGHDLANGRTDGRTDGRTPYHNTSEVSLRAYKRGVNSTWSFTAITKRRIGSINRVRINERSTVDIKEYFFENIY